MKYRKAHHSDASGIAKLLVDTWRATYSDFVSERILQKRTYKNVEERWKSRIKELTEKDRMVIVETQDGELVGISWGRTEKLNLVSELINASKFKGELMAIYVLENYQRKKIGTNLVFNVVEFLLKKKVQSMLVWVFKNNPAKNFYIHLGAVHLGDQYLDLDGEKYLESAYGWDDIRKILELEREQ